MKQYTTKWAKEQLEKNPEKFGYRQDKELNVISLTFTPIPREKNHGRMSEHPDGFKNSLVTREDLWKTKLAD